MAQTKEEALASRIVNFNINQLSFQLGQAPMEKTSAAQTAPLSFAIPLPDGKTENFNVVESPIMHPDFMTLHPDFKSYAVQSAVNPQVSGRISITPYGFNAVILSSEGVVHIRPLNLLSPIAHEVTLSKMDEALECSVSDELTSIQLNQAATQAVANGTTKRTFTLAIVGTGEFHDANGGSVAAARAVAMTSVNGIQAIFERELSVAFTLLTPHIYTDATTDPFNPGLNRVQEAAQAVEANFSGQGYDLGHVFHDQDQGNGELNTGGVAGLGVVCSNAAEGTGFRKAGGWSSSFDNVTPGWISLATHEFGHQFDMPHTFNGNGDNCTAPNHPLSTAYEIGSGTTIMSYQGICAAQYNIPSGGLADHYFHANSLDRAVTYMNTQTCHAGVASGNAPPVVTADICNTGPYTIPTGTPFRLTGAGVDGDGDQIYFCWEQYDEDGAGVRPTHGFIGAQAAVSTIAPLFRSFPPTTSPSRTFPNIELVKTGQYASSFEPLPTVARTLNFRLTGRDWKAGGGGIDCKTLAVTVGNSGPLSVTAPNGGENLTAGNATNVTWNVNGTDTYSGTVNIRLSIDGGTTYPYTLATATDNDGTDNVTIPAGVANTTAARVMVESAANTCVVFFDISDNNFTITSPCLAATSNICPTTAVNLAMGNGGLNLNMNQYFGGEITTKNFTITNASPTGPLANSTVAGGNTCQTPWGT
ncbi:MAG: hypothetical protein HKN76_07625, partial [Saprospiraceae bacterium]|nr:hypothetical protein [Saprospiraceae bacterium]